MRIAFVCVTIACFGLTVLSVQCQSNVCANVADFQMQASNRTIRVGDGFRVSCWSATLVSVTELCGSVDNMRITLRRLPLQTHKLNETAVYADVNATEAKHSAENIYECQCRRTSLRSVRVPVGVRLAAVRDFDCLFRDDDVAAASLECSFSVPTGAFEVDPNTNFTLQLGEHIVDCQAAEEAAQEQEARRPRQLCRIPPKYFDKFAGQFDLRLHMRDQQAQPEQRLYRLARAQCIIMQRPGDDLDVTRLASDEICLTWRDRKQSNHVHNSIAWSLQLEPDHSHSWNTPQANGNQRALCLSRLPHANYNYTLRLRQRYNDSAARWSEPLILNFRTAAKRPSRPPAVWPASYHLNPQNRSELRVFWQRLAPIEYNGRHFNYSVTVHNLNDNRPVRLINVKVNSNTALIKGLNTTTDSYKITIRSQNEVDLSINSSDVIIPQLADPGRRMPQKVARNKTAQRLSWLAPQEKDQLRGYVVFWCVTDVDDHNNCNESIAIEAQLLDATRTFYESSRLRLDSFNWAVSADYGDQGSVGSGGMYWLERHNGPTSVVIREANLMRHIQGVVALLVLGMFIYLAVRKYRFMSHIKVVLPTGVDPQPHEDRRLLGKAQPLEAPQSVRIASAVPQAVPKAAKELPLVVYANFKPLDLDAPAPKTNGHVTSQLTQASSSATTPAAAAPINDCALPPKLAIDPLPSVYVHMQPPSLPKYVSLDNHVYHIRR